MRPMMERLKIGQKAPAFSLPGVDGKTHSLDSFKESSVLVVIFTCNHCPYVKAYEDRIIALQKAYENRSVRFVGINSNEDKNHPEDSFEEMVKRASEKGFNFPYLRDASQDIAKAYGASHTPEIFVFDRERTLRYTGLIDDNWKDPTQVKVQHLQLTLEALIKNENPSEAETHAIGCTIKWQELRVKS